MQGATTRPSARDSLHRQVVKENGCFVIMAMSWNCAFLQKQGFENRASAHPASRCGSQQGLIQHAIKRVDSIDDWRIDNTHFCARFCVLCVERCVVELSPHTLFFRKQESRKQSINWTDSVDNWTIDGTCFLVRCCIVCGLMPSLPSSSVRLQVSLQE